jgi:hypothetical protein
MKPCIAALVVMPLLGGSSFADEIATDANIVTALDISDSIGLDALRLEIEGMARAIRSPEVLAAIQSGRYGRIGFAVFAWHHNQFPEVVAWTLIASEEDALAVSRTIEARLRVDVEREARNAAAFYIGRLTNLSQAIDHAANLLGAAPFRTGRSVVNIVGNGRDNVGEDAWPARDRLVGSGAIANGLVIGDDPSMLDYYREHVIGGPGAFVMSAADASALADALRNKFIYDIALAHAFIEQ